MPGPTTAYTQQYKMLQDKDHSDPHTRNQFMIDLTQHISEATTNNKDIILALDVNKNILPEGVPGPKYSITNFIKDTNLTDVYEYQYKQTGDTSRRKPTEKIDHVLISPKLLLAVKHSGFLPWNQIMESDHRTGFVDFDKNQLLGENTEDPTHNTSQKLSTNYPESIE